MLCVVLFMSLGVVGCPSLCCLVLVARCLVSACSRGRCMHVVYVVACCSSLVFVVVPCSSSSFAVCCLVWC